MKVSSITQRFGKTAKPDQGTVFRPTGILTHPPKCFTISSAHASRSLIDSSILPVVASVCPDTSRQRSVSPAFSNK
jgi:hypothetical protein